jgi:hypothetical protein
MAAVQPGAFIARPDVTNTQHACMNLKEEARDPTPWRTRFGRVHVPVFRKDNVMNEYRENTSNPALWKAHRVPITKADFLWKFSFSLHESYEEHNYTPRTKVELLNIRFLSQGACSDHCAKNIRLIN